MRHKIWRVGLAIFFLLGVTACSFSEPKAVRLPLRIEWTPWPGDWILLVAQDQGFFEKHGVQVEPVLYEVFDAAIPDLASEKIDGGLFVIGDLIPLIQNDNLRAVLIVDVSDGADQVVASPDIQSVSDLRGKRIGVSLGTFGELFVRRMLESANISMTEVTLIDVNAEAVPESIPSIVDAGHTWEPHTSQALENGQHVIFSSAETPGLIPDLLVLRTEILRQRPEDVRAFIAAWLEAAEFARAHPNEAIASIAKLSGMAPEEISFEGDKIYTLEDNRAAFSKNPGNDTTSIYYTTRLYIDFLVNNGSLISRPDVNQILDPSFLP